MTLVPCDTNRTRVLSRSGHCKTGDFAFSASRSVFQRKTLRQDRVRATIGNSVDLEHSTVWSCFVMTTERASSRVVDHRLDEPRQIIPQHGTLSVINEGTLSPFPAEAGHGLLIQTSVGTAACFGAWRTKRSG
jgi:hypothetical protein